MEVLSKTIAFVVPLLFFSFLLGKYIYHVYQQDKTWMKKWMEPFEKWVGKNRKDKTEENMDGKKYFISILWFSFFSVLFFFGILMLQSFVQKIKEEPITLSLAQIFNTVSSFVTNTNWQSYIGEKDISNWVQMIGITVQNFLSAGIGICTLFALFRGITNRETKNLGNFWKDLIHVILLILLPLSVLLSVLLVSGGVVQTFSSYEKISTLETKEEQILPLGPVASQVAIKQLGTNGGGFFGTNSAHPYENPTAITNYLECMSILLLPMSLLFTFGWIVKEKRQARSLLVTVFVILLICIGVVSGIEKQSNNYEGKEVRFGIVDSSIWSVFTVSASNGSVNGGQESYHPVSILVQLFLMGTGEVIFGGVGSGFYTLFGYVVITVFVAGLMIGRTPEYLGKKIEPYEMKMAMLLILATPFCILVTSSILCLFPTSPLIDTSTQHQFTQIFYAATSTGANNGSSLGGLASNWFSNILLGMNMLIARYVPIYATLALAESLGKKKTIPVSTGTLSTTTPIFVLLLIVMIILIGALSFLPAYALGPLAEGLG